MKAGYAFPIRSHDALWTNVLIFIIGITASCTLINSKILQYPSLTAFYLFIAGSNISIIVCGLLLLGNPKVNLKIPLPAILLLLWCFYVLIHSLLLFHKLYFYPYYMVGIACFFFSCYIVFCFRPSAINILYNILIALSLLEAGICFLQFTNILSSTSSYFGVAGSWVNPNVTAMFMALTVPLILFRVFKATGVFKMFWGAALLCVVIALLMLQCRSAYLGALSGSFMVCWFYFRLNRKLQDKRFRTAILLTLALLAIITIPLASYLYASKKASADGRKLIWKLSVNMIAERPFNGYGYDMFGKYYNSYQANYFRSGKASAHELENAGYVKMAYNEFLQNAIEGGIVGFLIFTALLLSLIFTPGKGNSRLMLTGQTKAIDSPDGYFIPAYAGVAGFCIMSFVNFSIQAIPVMCLFVLFAAAVSALISVREKRIVHGSGSYTIGALAFIAIITGIFLAKKQGKTFSAVYESTKAKMLIEKQHYQKAMNVLHQLAGTLEYSESYWTNCGEAATGLKKYKEAIGYFSQAKKYSAKPELYLYSAFCYEKQQQYKSALYEYYFAALLEPRRIMPRFAMMRLYLKMDEQKKALLMAENILSIKPKRTSVKAERYKKSAKEVVAHFEKEENIPKAYHPPELNPMNNLCAPK